MNVKLTDLQWTQLRALILACPRAYLGDEAACRRFVEAVLWVSRSGGQWRLVPDAYGNWNSIYKRFARWCEQGVWAFLLAGCQTDPDLEGLIIDTSVIRAHPCAAGAPQARGGQEAQALGRSRGGFSTKVHVSVDALGYPLRFLLTPGQAADIKQAEALVEGFQVEWVMGDKSYDADDFIRYLREDLGATPVIPPRANRSQPRAYDAHLYKERHLVECFINKIKHYRRVFSRFDKLASRSLGFLLFASALVWLL